MSPYAALNQPFEAGDSVMLVHHEGPGRQVFEEPPRPAAVAPADCASVPSAVAGDPVTAITFAYAYLLDAPVP